MSSSLPPPGQRAVVIAAILLGVSGILHVQGGLGHAAAEDGHVAHGEEAGPAASHRLPSWVGVVAGFGQLGLLVGVLLWPRRPALWMGAWGSAVVGVVDAVDPVAPELMWPLVLTAVALVVLFLALVEASARGRPVLGIRDVSGP